MNRSFTNRVFGGVCGGLAETLRLNVWIIRALLIVFSIISSGAGVLLYVTLWIALPQESLISKSRGNTLSFLLFVFITLTIVGSWVVHQTGQLNGPDGQNLLYPILFMVFSLTFLLRQVVRS